MHTILVIEKNNLFLEIILELLRRKGWQAVGTCNSRLGLHLAKKQMPSLIICDIRMSDPNGYQVLTTLRQDPITKNIPFIFFSADLTEGERYCAMKLRANDCLDKSCHFEELFQVIQTHLEKIPPGYFAQSKPNQSRNNSILIIEDDRITRSVLSKLLKSEKFNVISAENGRAGLQLAKKLNPHLILCDINMPNLDGYGVLKRLREDLTTAKTPFIFLTVETDSVSRRWAWQLGASDYLTKPVNSKKLLESIANQFKYLGSV